MKKYVVYDDDGNILRWGVTVTRNFEAKAKALPPSQHLMKVEQLSNKLDIEKRITVVSGKPVIKPKQISPTEL